MPKRVMSECDMNGVKKKDCEGDAVLLDFLPILLQTDRNARVARVSEHLLVKLKSQDASGRAWSR